HVKRTLFQLAMSLGHFPEKYSKEEYLSGALENYRSVSKWRYKIIYEVTDKYVNIINVFNTSQHPSKIRKDK
ncbi:MAG: type II toxin-antitoxin system RelE/ParE family toxin, partial [Kosmotogaceae bacterium]